MNGKDIILPSSQLSKVVSKVGNIVKGRRACPSLEYKSKSSLSATILPGLDFSSISRPEDSQYICYQIAERIENCLKEAKSKTLECFEVLIPCNLTVQIAQDIIVMSESEPYGLRGCLLDIKFEDRDRCFSIGQLKFGDRTTVPTFEMYLHLKRNNYNWISIIAAKILKNFGRQSLVISDGYKLSKRKLFRSE